MKHSKLTIALLVMAAVAVIGAAVGVGLRIAGDARGREMLAAQEPIQPNPPAQNEQEETPPEPDDKTPEPDAPASQPETPQEPAQDAPADGQDAEQAPDEEALLTARAAEILSGMTLSEKIYQMLFVTPEALTGVDTCTRAGDATRSALEQYPVGGIVYFAKNLQSREQTESMLRNSQEYAKYGLFLAVDEEGGTVARCAQQLGTTRYDSMRTYGATGDPNEAAKIGAQLAEDLTGLGFNVDFAPDADVLVNPDNTEIGSRSFGTDPELVAKMVAAEVAAMQEGGLGATLKHFPGLGATSTDSHDGLDLSHRTLEELREAELVPFRAGAEAGAGFIMAAHLSLPEIDDKPASLSRTIITGLLREELGYDGVVITDALNMGAISNYYTAGTAAVLAVQAGVDMLLMPTSISAAYNSLSSAVSSGTLTEQRIDESVLRILREKLRLGILN